MVQLQDIHDVLHVFYDLVVRFDFDERLDVLDDALEALEALDIFSTS